MRLSQQLAGFCSNGGPKPCGPALPLRTVVAFSAPNRITKVAWRKQVQGENSNLAFMCRGDAGAHCFLALDTAYALYHFSSSRSSACVIIAPRRPCRPHYYTRSYVYRYCLL